MKKIILFAVLAMITTTAIAQPVNRGTYGTQSRYASTAMKIANGQGVQKTLDTLVNGDTSYAYIWMGDNYNRTFELTGTTISGTVATVALTLFGYNNNSTPMTASQIAVLASTGNAQAITGATAYCAGCVGASSTTVPGASKKYSWVVPASTVTFDNYYIRAIQTGTATATYTGKVITQY
jgi:hypothetical protein